MSNVVQFPEPAPGSWLCTIELYRKTDGTIHARLAEMPPEVIEEMADTVTERMTRLSLWTKQAARSFLTQATDLAEKADGR